MHIVSVLIKKNCSFSIIFNRRLKGISIRIVNRSDIVWAIAWRTRGPMQGCNYDGFWSVITWTIYCLIGSDWVRSEDTDHCPAGSGCDGAWVITRDPIIIIMTSSSWCSWSPPPSLRGQDSGSSYPATNRGRGPGLDNKICNFTFTNTEGDYNQDKTPVIIWPCIYSHIIW